MFEGLRVPKDRIVQGERGEPVLDSLGEVQEHWISQDQSTPNNPTVPT